MVIATLKPEFAHLEGATLTLARCNVCRRAYYWSVLPKKCGRVSFDKKGHRAPCEGTLVPVERKS
jgi:hypothetical protein